MLIPGLESGSSSQAFFVLVVSRLRAVVLTLRKTVNGQAVITHISITGGLSFSDCDLGQRFSKIEDAMFGGTF